MNAQPGDWVMTGPGPRGTPTLAQRGILLTGSVHTHDELIFARKGKLCTGSAEPPHFIAVPWEQRLSEARTGARVMAVYRWRPFCEEPGEHPAEDAAVGQWNDMMQRGLELGIDPWADYQHGVGVCLNLLTNLKIPYDMEGIRSHAWNWLRSKVRFLDIVGRATAHKEYEVYCTEGVFAVGKVTLRDLGPLTGNQPLPAPIHAERLVRAGHLVLVEDWGLAKKIEEKSPA